MRLIMSNQDTQALAQKIIGDLVHLPVAGQVKLAMGADSCINRVRKAGLVKRIEIRVEQDLLAWSACHIQGRLDVHAPFGQGAGFIGADHVHAAEVFNRGEPFDNHLRLRHPFGAMSQVDADIAGNNCGVSPTASAKEKRKASRTGRAKETLMAKMATTSTNVTSIRK